MGARAKEHHPLLRTIVVGGRGGCRKNGSVGITKTPFVFHSLSRSFLTNQLGAVEFYIAVGRAVPD